MDSSIDNSTNDTATDTVQDSNACSSPATTAFYVNPVAGSDSNTGSGPTCALKTITAALTLSKDTAHINATINLAAGTYGNGETFPLIVDHGRSLIGAGATTTTIQGSSASYNTAGTGSNFDATDSAPNTHFLTILAGDTLGGANNIGATTLSGITILPASTVTTPTANYIGIVCIAGNGPNTNTTPPLPTPNLVLKRLTVGPNFDTAVVFGSSPTLQSACNALVTTSTFTGANAGIATGACGFVNPTLSWPSSQIGDGQLADANTFTGSTIDIFGNGCGSVQSYNVNHFVSGYRGIVLVSQAAQYFEVLGNTFDGTTSPNMGMGVNTNASAVISKLNDNTFTNISESAPADTAVGSPTGYAIALGSGLVNQAQRNVIHDNDNGIYVGGGLSNTFDFSDDGLTVNRNQIYCNSKTATQTGNGYDLILAYTGGSAANFAGNQWDNQPPSTSVSITASPNGTDYVTGSSGGANVGTSGAPITTACATGRVH